MEITEVRSRLIDFVEGDLVGPAHGETEVLEDQPRVRYTAGVLFPRETPYDESSTAGGIEATGVSDIEPDEEETLAVDDDPAGKDADPRSADLDGEHDDTITRANDYRPSAMGLSFLVSSVCKTITIQARAAWYDTSYEESSGHKNARWTRRPLAIPSVTVALASENSVSDFALHANLRLRSVVRRQEKGNALVTVSLYNGSIGRSGDTFFQVGFEVTSSDTRQPFIDYRRSSVESEDPEDLGLSMLYRNRFVFAVGHGCAASWSASVSDRTDRIETCILPRVRVPPIVPASGNSDYLNMRFLSGNCANPRVDIPRSLETLCSEYEAWIDDQETSLGSLDSVFAAVGTRHVELCRSALQRMRAGISCLEDNADVLDIFMLTNRVMLRQQHHSRLARVLDDPWVPLPTDGDYESSWPKKRGFWRTFQLAFFLMTFPSIVSEEYRFESRDGVISARDVVDLIWFPTGGGKTEAYLALTAFTIFYGRLGADAGARCQVMMRYTLRLLTSQQFKRAASLICACELERRRDRSQRFGEHPISLGLWVGMSLTPNTERDALRAVMKLAAPRDDHQKNPFQLLSCPWCGTALDDKRDLGYRDRGGRMVFQCPGHEAATGERCPFSTAPSPLPITVVDESIYRTPPSLIIGTVDKFAMLAWRDQAGAILKTGGGPDLIIQDELHLISGPLGSMVGLYEGAIEFLSSMNGQRPKIIASTATIRRAAEQCKALYDRPAFQFPPPGLDASDSFFAREAAHSPGRIYVGFLPTATSSPLTAQIRSIVAFQQGTPLVVGDNSQEALLDPYWTLVQYFSSLKELGRAATFITADIPEFLPTMHRRYGLEPGARRYMRESEEMTSRKTEDEIPKILQRLEQKYRVDAEWGDQALDTLLATNMISVGVDVDRLGLMMVVTQPKGTSEYIQASSRVGRSDNAPGIVFTLYNASRPRDRSHYEQFKAYHEAFYRFVEPTSVTPFSPPALERALHAVLVIAGRHVAGWKKPEEFEANNGRFREFCEFFRNRVQRVDPDHVREYDQCLERRITEWQRRRTVKWGDLSGLNDDPTLMIAAGSPAREQEHAWETPTSMRNVDVECDVTVLPRYP